MEFVGNDSCCFVYGRCYCCWFIVIVGIVDGYVVWIVDVGGMFYVVVIVVGGIYCFLDSILL